ncbi:MAG: HlyD family efflux transporter periplasmic adaptor subunit [Muribaculaceae bacterium]|nr:HlyD family efflux transporter periplasmic adaptor subunit [Muribaculaceae bacterium]
MDKIIEKSELKRASLKRWLVRAIWIIPIIILIFWAISAIGGKSVKASDITFAAVERGPLETAVAASGRIVPAFEEIIISPVSSRILAVYAQPGDSVREGMPLLQLDLQGSEVALRNLRDSHQVKQNQLTQLQLSNRSALDELEMLIDIKEMEVNRLAITVDNERRLDSLGSGTGDRVRQAETAYATGQLELKGLRKKLVNERERLASLENAAALELGNSQRDLEMMEYTLSQGRIPAPHDGILTYLSNSIGSTVAAGEKVAVVGDLSNFKVTADVPEGSSYKVRPGADVTVRIGNVELSGTVANVEPQSTSGAVPFTVTLADASNARLRPGVRVQLYVSYGFKDDVMRIPSGSFYTGPGTYNLFVADGSSSLKRREVKLGDSNRQWIEVISGLAPGEKVVTTNMADFEKFSKLKLK